MRGCANLPPGERAFSLVEIMVAVGLLAVIIIGLVLAFNQVQRAFRSGTGQADVMEGGRAAMSVITRDLQEMTAYGNRWMTNLFAYRAFANSDQKLPSGDPRVNSLCDMFFIAKRGEEWALIAYRVDATNDLIGSLMRLEMVFTNSVPPGNRVHVRPNPPATFNFTNVLQQRVGILDWLADPANPDFHRVAGNLVHFSVVAYDTNGVAFGPTNNFGTNYTATFAGAANDVYQFSDKTLPAYVDVEMAVMEPDTAERLHIRAARSDQQGRDYLRERAGRVDVFRQRIPIRPAATSVRPPD